MSKPISRKARDSEFEVIWEGLKRCMTCGFALAHIDTPIGSKKRNIMNEDSLHATYHGKFNRVRDAYGDCVLYYKEFRDIKTELPTELKQLRDLDYSMDIEPLMNSLNAISDIVNEIDEWISLDINSFNVTEANWASNVKNYISEIRELLKKDRSNLESVLSIVEEVSLPYHYLIDYVINIVVKLEKNQGTYSIAVPNFSFSLSSKINYLDNIVQVIPIKKSKIDNILDRFFKVSYTESLRLWDLCKPHPAFEDYKKLLWSTKKFQDFISVYLPEFVYNEYILNNKSNRSLVDYHFIEAPFYFGKVELSEYAKNNETDLYDLSYLDNFIYEEDDDSMDDKDDLSESEIEETERALEVLFKKASKK